MRFIVAVIIVTLVAFVFTKLVKKAPFALYALVLAADAAYAYGLAYGVGSGFWAIFLPLMQRCTLAMAFLTVVMFVGVLQDGSPLKARLAPIRRQLSIAGCLLALCHVFYYAYTYVMQIQGILGASAVKTGLAANLFVSLGISVLLTLLLLVLMVTSFTFIKSHMHGTVWKRVQKFSYLFYALIYVHLMIILLPPALSGKEAALESVAVYTVIFVAYAILRIRRHKVDAKEPSALANSAAQTH